MYKKLIAVIFLTVVATGCSAPWDEEPAPSQTISFSKLPPDSDPAASQKAAQSFVRARAEDGSLYPLRDAIEHIFGDWEKGSDRAFIATSLDGAQATPENGKLIANAFANWRNSETGRGRVSVYGKDGNLLYAGDF
ncbi:hypothetical protein [Streptomyces sp. NPDC006971]|uniref:hypothetical protein n=1 Tax=Streptomyces sp. NPDC006971 TaxID=3154784 RepID=UPI0033FEBDC1